MPREAIHAASEADNAALRELERACPQGTRLKIYSQRDDYFFRSRLYGNDHTLVAEDRAQGRLIGVMAAALKDVFSYLRLRRGGSWAAVGLFRAARTQRTRVVRIPLGYKLLRPLFGALSPLLPLPRIPAEGGTIGYYCVFNPLAEGPQGMSLWRELLAHANNLALAEGAALLTGAFDPGHSGNPFLPQFRRGALNRIEYLLGVRALAPGVPETVNGYFPDVRDMN